MIILGAIKKTYHLYNSATPFSLYGAVRRKVGPELEFKFPLLGPILTKLIAPDTLNTVWAKKTTRVAPTSFSMFVASKLTRTAPTFISVLGGKLNTSAVSINITGLVISNISVLKTFTTPSLTYNIYPYQIGDIKGVYGTDVPYKITNYDLTFDSLPEGPISLIPFNRLKMYTNEIQKLEIVNIISNRMDFTDILVSGDFEFSLNSTGPWTNELSVVDTFYVKSPDLLTVGVDYTKAILVTAKAIPLG